MIKKGHQIFIGISNPGKSSIISITAKVLLINNIAFSIISYLPLKQNTGNMIDRRRDKVDQKRTIKKKA